jgi:hypothetical protein
MTTKRKVLQYCLFWLYTLFALGIPIILIIDTYGLFEQDNGGIKIMTGGILIGVLLLFYFRKHIKEAVNNMEEGFLKYTFIAIRELMPLIIIYVVFLVTSIQFENITFILKWSCISNAVALGIRAYHLYIVEQNKLLRKGSE